MMKVLIIGSGGREHALAWKARMSSRVKELYCAPGNAGMAEIGTCIDLPAEDVNALTAFSVNRGIDLVVVGPEQPLAEGIVDRMIEQNIPVFGPTAAAAKLESSKVFSKEFLYRFGIPTAAFDICASFDQALMAARKREGRCAVKADGLAAGKGVIVCREMHSAVSAIQKIIRDREFGEAGSRVVVEDLLEGQEASIMAICDGDHYILLDSSQDHKALNEGDKGPNTGGMGAYSPAPLVNPYMMRKIREKIIAPALNGMNELGCPFKGVLYAGIMIQDRNPSVLEFNVRFGDPETQPVLMRLETDLIDLIEAAITGKLHKFPGIKWVPGSAVCVVLVSGGYPGSYRKGLPITGLESIGERDDLKVFMAGVKKTGNHYLTSGGRVLGVTARGNSIRKALDLAYQSIRGIHFDDCYYRRDIGWQAVERNR